MRGLGDGGTVTVCGGGLTGAEAATEIAEAYPAPRVTLISTDEPGAVMGGGPTSGPGCPSRCSPLPTPPRSP
ncbi:hypothetical protein GCM10010182_08460 [Actinomadura cremea]|nr:hypothetical protein GCM10010182_08460 [Actinomadura cremea]